MKRCAQQFQQFDRAVAIDFYLKGARLAEQEDKSYQAADLYEKAAMQIFRNRRFSKNH